MITLVLEASTYTGSVAVLSDGALLAERVVAMRGRDHEALMPAVAEVLASKGVETLAPDVVVCGSGPGAFTSLRIAAAIAKGLASASGATLVPLSSLLLAAASRVEQGASRVLVVSDAMRGEAYAQPYEITASGDVVELAPVQIVVAPGVDALARTWNATIIGPQRTGNEAALPLASNARFLSAIIAATRPADLAAWEPGYGRLPEAQVKWEATHGRALGTS